MPSLKKRNVIRENKKSGIEDGGWDGGSRFENELIKIEAKNDILAHSWRNVLAIISFIMMGFCLYNAWIDQHNNQYQSIFEITSGLISASVVRFAMSSPTSGFERALQIAGIVQFVVWAFLTKNEYIYHIHCLPLGSMNALLATSSFMFLRSMKKKNTEINFYLARIERKSKLILIYKKKGIYF